MYNHPSLTTYYFMNSRVLYLTSHSFHIISYHNNIAAVLAKANDKHTHHLSRIVSIHENHHLNIQPPTQTNPSSPRSKYPPPHQSTHSANSPPHPQYSPPSSDATTSLLSAHLVHHRLSGRRLSLCLSCRDLRCLRS